MLLDKLIDLEEIQRQTIKILYDGLNDVISSTQGTWTNEDTDYYASIGRDPPGFSVETIRPECFWPGTVPSLILNDVNNYPNVAAIAYIATPTNSRDDVGEMYQVVLNVEVMVKSLMSEPEANSRINKTMEAIQLVLVGNRSLNHIVPWVGGPRQTIGDVFVRREAHSSGDRWFWQGGVLEFRVDKYVKLV